MEEISAALRRFSGPQNELAILNFVRRPWASRPSASSPSKLHDAVRLKRFGTCWTDDTTWLLRSCSFNPQPQRIPASKESGAEANLVLYNAVPGPCGSSILRVARP